MIGTITNMIAVNPIISIIILNVDDLNSPIKRNCQSRLTKNKQKKECQQCVFYKKPLEVDTVRNEER